MQERREEERRFLQSRRASFTSNTVEHRSEHEKPTGLSNDDRCGTREQGEEEEGDEMQSEC